MTVDSLEERKRYINQIKASFHDPGKSSRYRDLGMEEAPARPEFGMFKVKALLAVVIFGAFVYCDRNEVTFYKQNTDTVYERIAETFSVEKAVQSLEKMIK